MSCGRYVVGGAECAVGVQPAHLILIELRAVPEWALRHVERAARIAAAKRQYSDAGSLPHNGGDEWSLAGTRLFHWFGRENDLGPFFLGPQRCPTELELAGAGCTGAHPGAR
jgi:hypothetical protein